MLRRTVVTMITAALMAIAIASPAAAQDKYLSKTTGVSASAYWTQFDETPTGSAFGNVHIGSLWAYEMSTGVGDAFVWIDDYDCPTGVHPYDVGGEACVYKGFRHGWGTGLGFTVTKKLTSGKLTGSLEMSAFSHDGGDPQGDPIPVSTVSIPVNVTWRGTGGTYKESSTYRWSDGTSSYSGRYRATNRNAVMGGTIGSMGFDPDNSQGWLSNFSEAFKSRSK